MLYGRKPISGNDFFQEGLFRKRFFYWRSEKKKQAQEDVNGPDGMRRIVDEGDHLVSSELSSLVAQEAGFFRGTQTVRDYLQLYVSHFVG